MRAPLALTLDLDDTLWPIGPAIAAAEAALDAWLAAHAPATARRWPAGAMRDLREGVARERADLAHDASAQRRLCIARALADSGDDPALADGAFDAFFAARNRVECYPDAVAALERLAACVPLAAVTNGNADLGVIGLARHFHFTLGAREHGRAKPSPCIFHAACARLGLAPGEVMHVGDDPRADVEGAARAGLKTCWLVREGDDGARGAWPLAAPRPDLAFGSLSALADWLEAARDHAQPTAPDRTAA